MIRNILKISMRFFLKYKGYSFVNIFGLAVGIATCILIFLFVQDEVSYDSFYSKVDDLYRVEQRFVGEGEDSHWAASQGNMIPNLVRLLPEIQYGAKILPSRQPIVMTYEEKYFTEENVIFADSAFLQIFDFELLYGDLDQALAGPEKVVITETVAERYFGEMNPMGKLLKSPDRSYKVSAVMKDLPDNTHFGFDMIIAMDDIRSRAPQIDDGGPFAFYSYIRKNEKSKFEQLYTKAQENALEILGYENDTADMDGFEAQILFLPVKDIHLKGHAEKELSANSDIRYIYIFSVIAILVLIVACINYMNLATARSARRGREVGVRKVMGADARNIFNQFMSESLIMAFIALVLALIMIEFVLPYFNQLTAKSMDLQPLDNIPLLIGLIVVWLFVGISSGSYPSVFLSRFNPLKVLYANTISSNGSKTSLFIRRGLVIFQFSISVLLIIGAFTIYKQLNFIQNKKLGFDKENVIVLPLHRSMMNKTEVFKKELLRDPQIVATSASSIIPGKRVHILPLVFPDLQDPNAEENEEGENVQAVRTISGDMDFVKVMGLKIVEGRDFSEEYKTDSAHAFILNEAAVREFELENPVGTNVQYIYALEEPKEGKIIGVVKDFHYASLHAEVEPLMIHVFPPYNAYMSIRYQSDNTKQIVKKIAKQWKDMFPGIPFDYFFLDTTYDNMYKAELNMGRIVNYFTILAIIIACLGLFGLASYVSEQRTKEIGIRKVLGASEGSIIKSLSKEFLILVFIANIISLGPAYWILDNWLNSFEYRTEISWVLFALTVLVSFSIALITVISQAYRAAVMNPVNALKYE